MGKAPTQPNGWERERKTMAEDYNGWANRETWAVRLWLDNDQGIYYSAQDAARGAIEELHRELGNRDLGADGLARTEARRIGDAIRDLVESLTELVTMGEAPNLVGMVLDIGSQWRVDWDEVCDSYRRELADECTAEQALEDQIARNG
jgi:hypothetical protein